MTNRVDGVASTTIYFDANNSLTGIVEKDCGHLLGFGFLNLCSYRMQIWRCATPNRAALPALGGRGEGESSSASLRSLRSLAALFPNKMRGDFARVTRAAVFPDVNSLPGSERQPAIVKRDAQIHSRERGAEIAKRVRPAEAA